MREQQLTRVSKKFRRLVEKVSRDKLRGPVVKYFRKRSRPLLHHGPIERQP